MQLNVLKSGIMHFGPCRPKIDPSFPVVEKYKYLGMIINSALSPKDHISSISKKVFYQTRKLRPVLLKNNFKLNVSLYQTLILPLYRLAFPIFQFLNKSQK
jgi:hypothetical protein